MSARPARDTPTELDSIGGRMRKEPMERTRLRGQHPRILMVGNSLTSANGMPDLLAALTGAQVAAVTRGGARLAEFCNPATKTGGRVAALLEAKPFDFLIMQDMSHLAASNPRAHARAAVRASELARRNGAVPVLLGTWAYRADCPRLEKLGLDADRMRELMSEGGRPGGAGRRGPSHRSGCRRRRAGRRLLRPRRHPSQRGGLAAHRARHRGRARTTLGACRPAGRAAAAPPHRSRGTTGPCSIDSGPAGPARNPPRP